MKMAQTGSTDGYVIRSCEPGQVTVQIVEAGGEPALRSRELAHGAIIAGRRLIEDWGPGLSGELSREHLQPLLELKPELVLLGIGAGMQISAMQWAGEFHQVGIGFDVMTTDAACRTYNILSGEGRNVAVALVF